MTFPRVQSHLVLSVCGVVAVLTIAALVCANVAGLRFNDTASMPRGLWRVVETQTPLRRGEIVTICPPDTKPIRQGAERGYLRLAAVRADMSHW